MIRSVSRSALLIEDHAALTGRTDQPLARTGVAQAEGAAPDLTNGESRRIARTHRFTALGERRAHGALLVRSELRSLAHPQPPIWSTSFPNCAPRDNRSNARRPSDIGSTLSTVGRRRPAFSSATTASNSASLPM